MKLKIMSGSDLTELLREDGPQPPYNYDVIYAVGDDARIHVLSYGSLPDDLEEEIQLIESEIESAESPGVYKGKFKYFPDNSYFNDDGGYWDITDGKLLFKIPEIKDVDE